VRYSGDLDLRDAWVPDVARHLSKKLGTVPYLLLVYRIDDATVGEFFVGASKSVPGERLLRESSRRYVNPSPVDPAKLPNIIAVLAESTFDPARAFLLNRKLSNQIMVRSVQTQSLGPLYVNVIGGGTWVTEFEAITGLDSRLFGLSGYYSHASLSHFLKPSFATYLRQHGYGTLAFYPASGAWLDARRAFTNYGFQRFYDSFDLGRGAGRKQSDVDIANDVMRLLEESQPAPFFAFVSTNENHSPHPCLHFKKEALVTTLARTDDFPLNCALNEYIRRMESTAKAFQKLTTYLEGVERQTGRPFVILIFGDHQPYTFTYSPNDLSWPVFKWYDYWPFRVGSARETVFHIRSSVQGKVTCCDVPPPATLLPSLLSAYVAADEGDLYLRENFYLYAECGSDFLKSSGADNVTHSAKLIGLRLWPTHWPMSDVAQASREFDEGKTIVTPACREAYERALSSYRARSPLH
jgi:hypothetical protein